MIRPATKTDLPAVCELLAKAQLPTTGVANHLDTFAVLESGGSVIAVGGLEFHNSIALLRSLAVAPTHQGRGLASQICSYLEADASTRGVHDVYLLTETAESFFARRGYAAISRDDAPPEITSSDEFAKICPESAVLMRRGAAVPGLVVSADRCG